MLFKSHSLGSSTYHTHHDSTKIYFHEGPPKTPPRGYNRELFKVLQFAPIPFLYILLANYLGWRADLFTPAAHGQDVAGTTVSVVVYALFGLRWHFLAKKFYELSPKKHCYLKLAGHVMV